LDAESTENVRFFAQKATQNNGLVDPIFGGARAAQIDLIEGANAA
jgi:hypothetical protein